CRVHRPPNRSASGLGRSSRSSRSKPDQDSTALRFSGSVEISVKRRDLFASMTPRTETAPAELGELLRREEQRRRSLTLTEQTYEDVRSGIIRGGFPAGSVLAEGTLAESLGVSKTPPRHPLPRLTQQGSLPPPPP